MKNEQNTLFNKSFLSKKLHEYKSDIKDNAAIFLKWHNDKQKEEALQTNFLNDIFGKVLGYEIDTGEAEFNLLTEYKTQKDGTKVDGILGFITKDKRDIRVAIELKAKNTTNLDLVEKQAFEYRDKIDGIEWVITSNTNEIRLYSAGSGGRLKHQSWTLLELANSLEKQKEFYFLLSKDRLFGSEKSISPTHKLLEDNTKEEELIEKRFYNDYKDLRKKLFNHLREQNPQKEPTTILSKTQKILDRIIFICFCEDLNLLPDKIFTKLLKTTQEAFIEITIWQQIKGLFNAIDKGWPQKNINKFNGGLFAKDAELDELVLQDDILKEIIKISDWDFGSELTVNILGHIFEQSITDLEEIKANISGETHDKKQGKRKKDGVFYTPEYITRYIVEEAVGGWLHDRKTELGIDKLTELTEEDFVKKGKKPSKNAQKHIDFWNSYAKILQNIKVLDPACGSGAFIVAVFNFLENEWLTLSETLRKLGDDEQAGLFSYSQVYKHILKNNIYGVDLNPESVQITKLSLWLKTANRSEKLTTLDANIKCGNSLIDDATVETGFYINNEGECISLAFNWQNEFPHVFENGGFDVVVGNPPYLKLTRNNYDGQLDYLINHYKSIKTANSKNLFALFIEKGILLSDVNSYLSFIVPEGLFSTRSYDDCVKYMQSEGSTLKELYFDEWVFDDATTGSVVFTFSKTNKNVISQKLLHSNGNISVKDDESTIDLSKKNNLVTLSKLCTLFKGMVIKNRDAVLFESKNDQSSMKFILGNCMSKYSLSNEFYTDYNILEIIGGTKDKKKYDISPRIIIRRTGNELCCTYIQEPFLTESTIYSCYSINEDINNLYVLCLLNSKLNSYMIRSKVTNAQAFPQILMTDLQELLIPQISPEAQIPFITHAQKMLDLTREFNEKRTTFIDYFRGKFALQKITRNLESWHTLEFADFIKELGKQKVSLSSTDEFDFKPLFDREKLVCVELQAQITKTNSEIDKMVYSLYGLSEEEVRVVEDLI